jgi:hypothetical protein
MSGQKGPEEAARLEAALDRIARAAALQAKTALQRSHEQATSTVPSGSEIAARLDGLIADLRSVLGTEI